MRTPIKLRGTWALAIVVPVLLLAAATMHLSFVAQRVHVAAAHHAAAKPDPYQIIATGSGSVAFRVGVYKPELTTPLVAVQDFDAAVGRTTSLLLTYSEWGTGFRLGIARSAYGQGKTLIVQIEPKGISMRAIVRGKYDRYLKVYAQEVRAFGHPVIMGFAHEMNGAWYSWGSKKVKPALWVQAWRHVVTVFRDQHATNVRWMWTIHHSSRGLRAYWPGAKYVDIVGVDGYFERPSDTYNRIFGGPVRAIRKLTSKPILISETAVGPGTRHMALDIARLFAGARRQHLAGIVWFDVHQFQPPIHQDWELEDHPRALAAFKAALHA